jgi:hypothetical protein
MIQINHLADVVLHVGGALHHHGEAISRIGADAGVLRRPVLGRLRVDGRENHIHGVVEAFESFVF